MECLFNRWDRDAEQEIRNDRFTGWAHSPV
jgi:hypothetical protein